MFASDALLALIVMTGAAQAAIECPATLPGAASGFELVGTAPTKPATLDGLRLFDGPPGEEDKPAPVELAPDGSTRQAGGFTANWIFAGDEKLLMVCTYRGTKAYYRAEIRPVPRGCAINSNKVRVLARCE